jgi:hypothetical protein
MIDTLLYHDRFIWRNETELRRLAPDEIAEVKSLIKKVCAWSGLSKAEWKIAWESFARNSDEFHPFPDMRAQRYALLLKHNILGGAFKYADGFYFIVLTSPKNAAILRHEMQHVIDDADNPSVYTSDCKTMTSLEMRAFMAQLQTTNVDADEIKRVYC